MSDEYEVDCLLLVDDDSITNFLNESLLSQMQFCKNISSTENLEEALQLIEGHYKAEGNSKTLLIFLDINMPVMDGFEFLDELYSREEIPTHKIDVIILSSSAHEADKERAKNYQILDYIIKPLTFEKIKIALDKKKIK